MKSRLLVLLLVTLTVASTLPLAASQDGSSGWAEWWDEDWHMRIPVTVRPRISNTLDPAMGTVSIAGATAGHPVYLEIDFTQAMTDAGWATDLGNIASFTLDPDSVRVVRYSGQTSADIPLEEVPSRFYPARFTVDRPERYDPSQNAVGTVAFLVEDDIDGPRHYYVYFDTLQNGKKAAPDYEDDLAASLADPHWTGRGTDFFGIPAPPVGGRQTKVRITALHDDTQVRVDRYRAPFDVAEGGICDRLDTPLRRHETLTCSTGFDTPFRVVADRPVVTSANGPGSGDPSALSVFPAEDGGVVGERVLAFPTPGHASGNQILAVCVDPEGCGRDIHITEITQTSNSGGTSLTSRTRTNSLDNPMGQMGYTSLSLAPGKLSIVEAEGDIVVASAGHGLQMFPGITGDPAGTVVPFISNSDVTTASAGNGTIRVFDLHTGRDVALDHTSYPAENNWWHQDLRAATAGEHHLFSVSASTPVTALAGSAGDRAVFPVGLNADLTQEFHLPLGTRLAILPQYDSTQVTLERYVEEEPVRVCCNAAIGRGGYKVIDAAGGFRVESSKPVTLLAYNPGGVNAYATFLPGRMESLDATAHTAEFWGYSVALDTSDGQETVVDVRPGEETVFHLAAHNLGRSADGSSITDRFDLSLSLAEEAKESNWTAEISTRTTPALSTGEAQPLTVLVRPPPSAEKGTVVDVKVAATSKGNSNLTSTLTLRVVVSVFHDFAITHADGSDEKTRVADGPDAETFPLHVTNWGTGEDTIELDLVARPSTRGWGLALHDAAGEPISQVRLEPDETRTINLTITPPETPLSPWIAVNVVGTSTEQVNIKREARATLVIESNLGVSLRPDARKKVVLPGGTTAFNVTVTNTGDAATVVVDLQGHVPSGFTATIATADGETHPDGLRADLSANGTDADNRRFQVNVTAAPGMLGGESLEVLLRAEIQSGIQDLDTEEFVILEAVVDAVHDVRLSTDTLRVVPGEAATFDLPVTNEGNGEANFRVLPARLPLDWQLTTRPESLRLPLGGSGELSLTITPPAHAPPGPAPTALRLLFDAGGEQEVPVNVTVANLAAYEAAVAGRGLTLTRGEVATYTVEVTNAGNVAKLLNITVESPDDIAARAVPHRIEVPPGGSHTVLLTLEVARNAAYGNATLRLVGVAADGSNRPILDAEVSVVRADLALEDVAIEGELEEGATVTFAATVRNSGEATARDVLVSLTHDGKAVDNRTVERIPVGETRLAVLKWTVAGSPRGLEVMVDPGDVVVEEDEGNNALAAVTGLDALVPGPSATATALLALAAALAVTRRRRCAR